jgi:hypothetical protein
MMRFRSSFVLAFTLFASAAFAGDARQVPILVSDVDGYGTTDCLASNRGCGKIVADAMCAREGFREALRFRAAVAGDLTASVNGSPQRAFVVYCRG